MSAAPSARPRHPWPFMSPLRGGQHVSQQESSPGDPKCEGCGAPLIFPSSALASICPRGEHCALYQAEGAGQGVTP